MASNTKKESTSIKLLPARVNNSGLCGTEFEPYCAIYKEDEVGYTHPDMIPGCQMGEKPVF